MGLAFYSIPRCQNTRPKVAHVNISQKAPNQSLLLKNTRSFWKKLTQSENVPPILGNGDFIRLYSKVPTPSPSLGATHLDIIQTATIWSLELQNIKGYWKQLKQSEKHRQNIRKTLALPRNGLSIPSY